MRSAAPQSLLIRGARLHRGDGSSLDGADVAVERGRIVEVGARAEAPEGAEVIEAAGRTLIPGLIDAHLHLDHLRSRNLLQAAHHERKVLRPALASLLEHGITTIRAMADPVRQILRLRDRVNDARVAGPWMVVAGPALTAPGGHPAVTVAGQNPWLRRRMVRTPTTVDQARSVVDDLHRAGVDLVKLVVQGGSYSESGIELEKLPLSLARAIIDRAHDRGLRVAAHTHWSRDVAELVQLGVDSIEHGVLEEDLADEQLLARWASSGAALVPTLVISQWVNDRTGQAYLARASANLARAHRAGVRIAAGTDSMVGAMAADSLHEELRLMVAAGLEPAEVLQAATGRAAGLLGLHDRGVVRAGAVADLVLLGSDPLDAIENVSDIDLVISRGRIVHRRRARPEVVLVPVSEPGPPVVELLDRTRSQVDQDARIRCDMTMWVSEGARTLTWHPLGSDDVLRTETTVSDPTLVTREWTCSVPASDTELRATSDGRRIRLTGTFEGHAVDQGHTLGPQPWLQWLHLDAASFVLSELESLEVVAIGTSGRGALRATTFELSKPKAADSTCRVDLVMPRWRRFWAAEVDYDALTGALLSYRVRGEAEPTLVLDRQPYARG